MRRRDFLTVLAISSTGRRGAEGQAAVRRQLGVHEGHRRVQLFVGEHAQQPRWKLGLAEVNAQHVEHQQLPVLADGEGGADAVAGHFVEELIEPGTQGDGGGRGTDARRTADRSSFLNVRERIANCQTFRVRR